MHICHSHIGCVDFLEARNCFVIAYVNNVFNINIDVNSLIGIDTQIIDKAIPVLPTKSKYVELAQKNVDENPASYDKILKAMIEAGISE